MVLDSLEDTVPTQISAFALSAKNCFYESLPKCSVSRKQRDVISSPRLRLKQQDGAVAPCFKLEAHTVFQIQFLVEVDKVKEGDKDKEANSPGLAASLCSTECL
ncbi:unnamed protein product [Lepidochelys olivacea]